MSLHGLRRTRAVTRDLRSTMLEPPPYQPLPPMSKLLFVVVNKLTNVSHTGQYCDVLLAQDSDPCSDCNLRTRALRLNSPIGYDPDLHADFSSLTSSCSMSTHSFTMPPSALWSSITSTPSSPSTSATTTSLCNTIYHKPAGQTCNDIANSQSVSTLSLIKANGWDLFCNFIPQEATDIYLPARCPTYQWSDVDTCNWVANLNNITVDQLKTWNPDINTYCTNLNRFRNSIVCVGPPDTSSLSTNGSACPSISTVAPNTSILSQPGLPYETTALNSTDSCDTSLSDTPGSIPLGYPATPAAATTTGTTPVPSMSPGPYSPTYVVSSSNSGPSNETAMSTSRATMNSSASPSPVSADPY